MATEVHPAPDWTADLGEACAHDHEPENQQRAVASAQNAVAPTVPTFRAAPQACELYLLDASQRRSLQRDLR